MQNFLKIAQTQRDFQSYENAGNGYPSNIVSSDELQEYKQRCMSLEERNRYLEGKVARQSYEIEDLKNNLISKEQDWRNKIEIVDQAYKKLEMIRQECIKEIENNTSLLQLGKKKEEQYQRQTEHYQRLLREKDNLINNLYAYSEQLQLKILQLQEELKNKEPFSKYSQTSSSSSTTIPNLMSMDFDHLEEKENMSSSLSISQDKIKNKKAKSPIGYYDTNVFQDTYSRNGNSLFVAQEELKVNSLEKQIETMKNMMEKMQSTLHHLCNFQNTNTNMNTDTYYNENQALEHIQDFLAQS
ncbi:MAG: hypothetical protein KBC30_01080 [Planctomycetes bacterium]|nr:hypothetical protein [Planctomycetota bacterium]